jgi:carbonic anhydrase
VVTGQHPFAVILTCSDSRVPPEVIFDQGIGDLFVIRNAGNIVDDVVIGSIEYAVEHLHTPLVIVLGHQQCGAVTAALKGGKATGHIASVIEKILPAVADARKQPGDSLLNAIDANVARMVNELRASHPVLAEYYNE